MKIPQEKLSQLCQHWHIHKLSLFGSVLRDDFTADSDIDMLVEFELGFTPSFFKLHQIQEELLMDVLLISLPSNLLIIIFVSVF